MTEPEMNAAINRLEDLHAEAEREARAAVRLVVRAMLDGTLQTELPPKRRPRRAKPPMLPFGDES